MKKYLVTALLAGLPALLFLTHGQSKESPTTETPAPTETFSPYVDAEGNISLPENFRKEMSHLGSWYVPEGGEEGFHDVYADQETVQIFRETGKFRDGAVLVKELRPSTAGTYTTGEGVRYATEELKHWFVMIKDTENRFEDNPVWGEGWGWGLFKPDDISYNRSKNYKTDCLACHIPARTKDWIYTEAYPTLWPKKPE